MAPHGYCLLWDPILIWGSVISDALIAIAYFTIPAALVHVVRSRNDTGFGWVFWAFAMFIVACGFSHVMHVWNLWHGDYAAEVVVKAATAAVSVITAVAVWLIMPRLIAIPSTADLRAANAELRLRIEERDRAFEQLELETAGRAAAQSQAQLLRVSRLSAMGAMASTIAHELNQPLTASSNYLAIANRTAANGGEVTPALKDSIEKAQAQGVRVNEIIRRMRAFTTRGEVARRPEKPVALLNGALSSLKDRIRQANVDVSVVAAENVPAVAVDRVQIEQVLINLLRNAIEAMEGSASRQIVAALDQSGPTVEFRIRDSGHGFAGSDPGTVFQLFNSRKQEGMGLGLPLCRTIVEAHGGRIWAEEAPGGGAVFIVALPAEDLGEDLADPPSGAAQPHDIGHLAPRRGSAR